MPIEQNDLTGLKTAGPRQFTLVVIAKARRCNMLRLVHRIASFAERATSLALKASQGARESNTLVEPLGQFFSSIRQNQKRPHPRVKHAVRFLQVRLAGRLLQM
jgi:hypothetical protein